MLLAIDQSTDEAGLVLLDGEKVLARQQWRSVSRGSDHLFKAWQTVFTKTGIAPAQVDRIVVGLGPGNYTGLRVSLAAARLWALPGNLPVMGVGSALTMAVTAIAGMQTSSGLPVVVVGDARRDSVWMIRYPAPVGYGSPEQPTVIRPRTEWMHGQAPAIWISADWDRLGEGDGIDAIPGVVVHGRSRVDPAVMGLIARHRDFNGLEHPPLRPVYPRPAVEHRQTL